MSNNLLIFYDLYRYGQNYEAVSEQIKSLGAWAKVHKSFWYVRSNYAANSAAEHVWRAMDANDTLFVVNATNGEAAWYNLADDVSEFLKENWS